MGAEKNLKIRINSLRYRRPSCERPFHIYETWTGSYKNELLEIKYMIAEVENFNWSIGK